MTRSTQVKGVLLEMLRLHCPTGSAMAPETAGPRMYPSDHAEPMIDKPNAWNFSSLASDIIALKDVKDPKTK